MHFKIVYSSVNHTKKTNMKNFLCKFKAAQISLNKVGEIELCEYKAERK